MATTYDNPKTVLDSDDDEDHKDFHDYLYDDDKTIDDLSDERGENWTDTYHWLLEKLDDSKDY